jgi:hypothetical protein
MTSFTIVSTENTRAVTFDHITEVAASAVIDVGGRDIQRYRQHNDGIRREDFQMFV